MVTRGDHFYCTDPEGELAPSSGYEREGETGYVFKTAQPGTIPIYRFYNPTTRDHFYTRDPNGEIGPPAYQLEGIEWYMYPSPSHGGLVALYRWYHPTIGDHFYTTDPTGELAPSSGYNYEGILGYLYPFSTPWSTPLYRWYLSGLMVKFEFSPNITAAQKKKLYERHSFAYYRAGLTQHLTPTEKSNVRALYWGRIHHDVNNGPGVNGSAFLGGRQLFINFNVLFPQGDNEIAQTLLHEMMHCAGYSHPSKSGTPGDNGPYFGSAPLRAELAIAGVQSDVVTFAAADADAAEDGVVREVCGVVDVDADERIAAAAAATATAEGEEGA